MYVYKPDSVLSSNHLKSTFGWLISQSCRVEFESVRLLKISNKKNKNISFNPLVLVGSWVTFHSHLSSDVEGDVLPIAMEADVVLATAAMLAPGKSPNRQVNHLQIKNLNCHACHIW